MNLYTNKANPDIRKALQNKNMKQWQLADLLGISEFTLSRWLRNELTEERKNVLLKAIEEA